MSMSMKQRINALRSGATAGEIIEAVQVGEMLAIVERCFHEDGSLIAEPQQMEAALRRILSLIDEKQGD